MHDGSDCHCVVHGTRSLSSRVSRAALCDRLDDGRLFAAGLDVFEGEPTPRPRLLTTPHLVLTPHVGSATRRTRQRMIATAAERLAADLARGGSRR